MNFLISHQCMIKAIVTKTKSSLDLTAIYRTRHLCKTFYNYDINIIFATNLFYILIVKIYIYRILYSAQDAEKEKLNNINIIYAISCTDISNYAKILFVDVY